MARNKTNEKISFKVAGTIWMVCFVMFYKLCERAEQTFSMYLVDKHVPTTTLAAWSTILKTFSLAGSTYAGFRFLRKKVRYSDYKMKRKLYLQSC